MKLFLAIIWLLCCASDVSKFVVINDILYKIPDSELTIIKTKYNIQEKDITIFNFNKDSCLASTIEWIRIPSIDPQFNDPYRLYRATTTPLFICDGKLVDIDHIYRDDIQSLEYIPINKAVAEYGCKGLNPIFILKLRYGKVIQSNPVGERAIKVGPSLPSHSMPLQIQDSFTIIGKTKGFRDSTILYLKKAESGSLKDNLDSTLVIENSFTFRGTISEPCPYYVHTGYTGWDGQPPESFYSITFFVNNSTIYLNDEIGNLKYSRISGSQLQNDNNEFNKMNFKNDTARDSLNRIFMKLTPADSVQRKFLREMSWKNYQTGIQLSIDFIKVHPNSLISVWLLDIYKTSWGRKETKDLFGLMNPENQNTSYGKTVNEYIKLKDTVKVEKQFTDIELKNLNGELVKLSSLKGKYILLDFWSSYCGPCRKEHPFLLKLYNEYREKGFEIYAVSLDEKKEVWQQAVAQDKITWITVSDLKGANASEAALIYEVSGIPKNFLIDPNGRIIAQDLHGEYLAIQLKEIFNSTGR